MKFPRITKKAALALGAGALALMSLGAAAPAKKGEVARRATPLSREQALAAIRPHVGNQDAAAMLTAQWSLETANGTRMFNFNFGGIKGTSPQGLTYRTLTHEGHGDTRRQITDNFRAYTSASQGAADFVSLIKRRYPSAYQAALAGDADAYVAALKKGGYFTGDPAAYTRAVSSIYRSIR